jgi:hypothetical protein
MHTTPIVELKWIKWYEKCGYFTEKQLASLKKERKYRTIKKKKERLAGDKNKKWS